MSLSRSLLRTMAVTIATAVLIAPALADVTARDIIAGFRKKDDVILAFWSGLEQGVDTANRAAATPLYCPQPELRLKDRAVVDIMERYLDRLSPDANGAPPDVLIAALRDAFPCAPKP